ncbi:hypothetical protein RFI_17459, partial [Reticulomyxa filosa]
IEVDEKKKDIMSIEMIGDNENLNKMFQVGSTPEPVSRTTLSSPDLLIQGQMQKQTRTSLHNIAVNGSSSGGGDGDGDGGRGSHLSNRNLISEHMKSNSNYETGGTTGVMPTSLLVAGGSALSIGNDQQRYIVRAGTEDAMEMQKYLIQNKRHLQIDVHNVITHQKLQCKYFQQKYVAPLDDNMSNASLRGWHFFLFFILRQCLLFHIY